MTRINKNQLKVPGGSTGEALVKLSNTDYDYDWGTVSSGGSGGGGTKLAIDTTQITASGGSPADYTVNIQGGTLGTNNAIRFRVFVSSLTIASGGSSWEVRMSYGATVIATAEIEDTDIVGTGMWVEGYIVSDGATNAQKGQIAIFAGLQTNNGDARSNVEYGTSAEDSTVNQNLEIRFVSANNDQTLVAEAIIVEKISSLGTLQPTEQFLGGLDLGDGQVKAITCSEDGSVIFVLFRDTGSSGLQLVRYEKDTNTGMYKVTHQESFGVSDGGGASIVIVGIYVYALYEGSGGSAGTMQGHRFLASDLSGATALTTGSPAYSNFGSAFSDGTDIYVNLSGTTWTQFTISGTTLTSGSTITGGMANASGSLYVGGNVYMIDASGNVQILSYGGGTFTLLDSDSYICLGIVNSSSSNGVNIIPIVDNIGYVAYRYSFTADTGAGVEVQESVILKSFTLPTP